MGKKPRERDGHRSKSSATDGSAEAASRTGILGPLLLLTALLLTGVLMQASPRNSNSVEGAAPQIRGRPNFLLRLIYFFLLEAALREPLLALCVPLSRYIARRLPGAIMPSDPAALAAEERMMHDTKLTWPSVDARLPPEWIAAAKRASGPRPYFLNHVRGSVRVRQAAERIAGGVGAMLQAALACWALEGESVASIGLVWVPSELFAGFVIGGGIVCTMFAMEILLGWVAVIGALAMQAARIGSAHGAAATDRSECASSHVGRLL